jgi:hypothetical protein
MDTATKNQCNMPWTSKYSKRQLFRFQASGILTKRAEIPEKIYHSVTYRTKSQCSYPYPHAVAFDRCHCKPSWLNLQPYYTMSVTFNLSNIPQLPTLYIIIMYNRRERNSHVATETPVFYKCVLGISTGNRSTSISYIHRTLPCHVTVPLHTDFYMMILPRRASFSCHLTAPKAEFSLCWTYLYPHPLQAACPRKRVVTSISQLWTNEMYLHSFRYVTCTFHNLLHPMASQYHSHTPAKWPQTSLVFSIIVHMQWLWHVAWVCTCTLMDAQCVN